MIVCVCVCVCGLTQRPSALPLRQSKKGIALEQALAERQRRERHRVAQFNATAPRRPQTAPETEAKAYLLTYRPDTSQARIR